MTPEIPPTAEGDLARTPLAHLLVYAVDRRLTGALFLTELTGTTHVVRFARGVPVKVKPGDGHAMLGELLVEAGIVSDDLLAGALAAKGLLGDVLLLAGRIDRERLEQLLEQQFLLRMVHLFELGPDTIYRYYDGHCELIDWGGDPASTDPLAVIWSGLKLHAPRSTKFDEVLAKLGDTPLAIHADAPLDRFGFDEQERATVDLLVERPVALDGLASWDLIPQAQVKNLVYTLLITRQIELGAGALPVGADGGTLREPTSTPASGLAALGRVQLHSTPHRMGAAAPDPPGDGERAPVVPSNRRRMKSRPGAIDTPGPEPASQPSASAPATSSVPPPLEPEPAPIQASDSPELAPPASDIVTGEAPPQPAPANEPGTPVTDDPSLQIQDDPTLSAAAFFELAQLRLVERELDAALDACATALQVEPRHPDYLALHAWIRSSLPGADVKALTVELDEVLQVHDRHVPARYYRGMLRKRLSDDAGALRDLQRVVELAPGHKDAARELVVVQTRQQKADPGLLSRIFKR